MKVDRGGGYFGCPSDARCVVIVSRVALPGGVVSQTFLVELVLMGCHSNMEANQIGSNHGSAGEVNNSQK